MREANVKVSWKQLVDGMYARLESNREKVVEAPQSEVVVVEATTALVMTDIDEYVKIEDEVNNLINPSRNDDISSTWVIDSDILMSCLIEPAVASFDFDILEELTNSRKENNEMIVYDEANVDTHDWIVGFIEESIVCFAEESIVGRKLFIACKSSIILISHLTGEYSLKTFIGLQDEVVRKLFDNG
ncbi:hypothetical protein LINGRAHAP2_LOCUS34972 [Linum grandiflorum]